MVSLNMLREMKEKKRAWFLLGGVWGPGVQPLRLTSSEVVLKQRVEAAAGQGGQGGQGRAGTETPVKS